MRNPVSRHDFNRASTHVDRSKEPQLTIEDGLDDYHGEQAALDYKDRCDEILLSRNGSESVISFGPGISDAEVMEILLSAKSQR